MCQYNSQVVRPIIVLDSDIKQHSKRMGIVYIPAGQMILDILLEVYLKVDTRALKFGIHCFLPGGIYSV